MTVNRYIKIWLDGKPVENSVKGIEKAMFSLIQTQKKMLIGSKEYVEAGKKIEQLRGVLKTHRQGQKALLSNWGKLKLSVKDFVTSSLGGFASVAGAIGLITTAAKKYIEAQKVIIQNMRTTNQLTRLQGEELENLSAKITATAKTFNKEYEEVLIAVNAVSEAMEVDLFEAADLVNKGFAGGADASGEFLDILKEYPTQFQAAGIEADEMIAIITQQVQDGIYSDKGIDTIKEGTIRLREMTKATKEALESIGISSDQLEQDLRNNTMTYFEAIQLVSEKLSMIEEQSPEVGTAIADIFGGPGEDAGLAYIQSLSTINTELDEVLEKSGELTALELELSEIEEDIQRSRMRNSENRLKFLTKLRIEWKKFVRDMKQSQGEVAMTQAEAQVQELLQTGKSVADLIKQESENLTTIQNKRHAWLHGQRIKTQKQVIELLKAEATAEVEKQEETKKTIQLTATQTKAKLLGIEITGKSEEELTKLIQKESEKRRKAAEKRMKEIEKAEKQERDLKNQTFKHEKELREKEEAALIMQLERELKLRKKQQEEALKQVNDFIEKALDSQSEEIIEMLDEQEKAFEQARAFRQQYLVRSLEDQKDWELFQLEELNKEKLFTEEEYLKLRSAINIKYLNEQIQRQAQLVQLGEQAVNSIKEFYFVKEDIRADQELQKAQNNYEQELKSQGLFNKRKEDLTEEDEQKIQEITDKYNRKREKLDEDSEERKKEIAKRYADIEFAITTARIAADTASAIIKALAQLGPIAGGIAATAIGVAGGAQIAIANEQRQAVKGYKLGGYSLNKPHLAMFGEEGTEWNAPNWMLNTPGYADIIGYLETARQNGHVAGGFAGGSQPAVASGADPFSEMNNNLMKIMQLLSMDREAVINWNYNDTLNVREKIDKQSLIESEVNIN